MGEKNVRGECKEPYILTIDCTRDELMELLNKHKKPKKTM